MAVIGTCSLCGGPVVLDEPWYGLTPQTPRCSHCNATNKRPYGPLIDMEKSRPYSTTLEEVARDRAHWQNAVEATLEFIRSYQMRGMPDDTILKRAKSMLNDAAKRKTSSEVED